MYNTIKKIFIRVKKTFLTKYLGTVTHFKVNTKVACLTFDDGPHPVYTPLLLDLLNHFDVKATFFMVGENACKYPDLVKRIRSHGHTIGNHTWNHKVFPDLTSFQRWSQIKSCAEHITPVKKKFFRPPWGKQNLRSRLDTFILGYDVIGWNVSVNDWIEYEPENLLNLLRISIKPGSIILLHDNIYRSHNNETVSDIYEDRGVMLKALEIFLKSYSKEYQFKTIDKMFQIGVPVRKYWIH
ncbi:MAG: polysaccharide deacetylase family protein [Balneolaceae bacterium]